jgi:hypothetical protein
MQGGAERFVDCVADAAAGLGHEVPVQVDCRCDGPMAEPAGNLRDRDAFGEGGAGERRFLAVLGYRCRRAQVCACLYLLMKRSLFLVGQLLKS